MQYRIILIALFIPFFGLSQINHCGNLLLESSLEQDHEGYRDAVIQTLLDVQASTLFRDGDTLTIPVVVHVVYNTNAENLSDQLINDQIEVLNQDFLRTNPDASETRPIFLDVAGTPNIQFKLADSDPNGQSTSGITRTQTNAASFIEFDFATYLLALIECGDDIDCIAEALNLELDRMKSSNTGGIDPWDVDRYLNIWICNMSIDIGGTQSPFLLGYAYPPMSAPNWPSDALPDDYAAVDGVVLHYEAVGPNNPVSGQLSGISDAGRTATHELGHYLGLRHIWGDGDCTTDDFMNDTPVAGTNSQPTDLENIPPCAQLHLKDSCTDDDLPDMVENYMDYSVESCQNVFTQEQSDLMRAMLLGPRASLLESNVFAYTPEITQKTVQLFPTQTSGIITLSYFPETDWSYQVLGVNGVTLTQNTDYYNSVIDISSLNAGIYFIQIIEGESVSVTRVVKY